MRLSSDRLQKLTKGLLLALLLVVLSGVGDPCHATPPAPPPALFDVKLEPITTLEINTPVTFNLTYSILYKQFASETGSVIVTLAPYRDPGDIISQETWSVQYDETYSHSMDFQLTIPENNIFTLSVMLSSGEMKVGRRWFFITIGDSIQFTGSLADRPMPITENSSKGIVHRDPIREKLTYEQLQVEYKLAVDLHDPSDKKKVEAIVGPIPDSCLFNSKRGIYIINTTLKNAFDIGDAGLESDLVVRFQWIWYPERGVYEIVPKIKK